MTASPTPVTAVRALLRALLASAAVAVGMSPADAGTIRDTIQATLDASPDVGIVKSNRLAVDQELRQARAGYLPSLDARAAVGPEHTRFSGERRRASLGDDNGDSDTLLRKEAQLTLSQMLFDGFQTKSEVERQTARVSSAAYRVQEAAEFVGLDAAEAHLEVLRFQDIVKLSDDNLKQLERYLTQVRNLERAGRADSADIDQTQARISQARATIASSRGSLADAIATYEQIVGEKPMGLTVGPSPVSALPKGADDAAAEASVGNPTVLIAASDVDVAEAELRGSRSNYYPRLDAELSASAADDVGGVQGQEVGGSALLVMRYNLFRGGADIAQAATMSMLLPPQITAVPLYVLMGELLVASGVADDAIVSGARLVPLELLPKRLRDLHMKQEREYAAIFARSGPVIWNMTGKLAPPPNAGTGPIAMRSDLSKWGTTSLRAWSISSCCERLRSFAGLSLT